VRRGWQCKHHGGEAHLPGNKGGGRAHRRGQSMVKRKGTAAQWSVIDGVGPAVADDNPKVLLQLRMSEGV
jgi:hypothetical protein